MIFVDQEERKSVNEFAYYNRDNEVESVKTYAGGTVTELTLDNRKVAIYSKDIPNLIKALQAAYNFWEKNNGK